MDSEELRKRERCQFAACGSLVMARCGGGGEGPPARRARGGSALARSSWRGAACGGGEGEREGCWLVVLELGRIRRGKAAPGHRRCGDEEDEVEMLCGCRRHGLGRGVAVEALRSTGRQIRGG